MEEKKEKKYFWLKMTEDFFRLKEVKLLRKLAGGDTFTIIYLKMMLSSLKENGKIYYEGIGKTAEEEIAAQIEEEPENVAITLNFLINCGLIIPSENQNYNATEFFMSRVPSMVGSESESAERVRRFREKRELNEVKTLQCNTDVTNGNTEIEIEIEIDIDKDIKNNIVQQVGQNSSNLDQVDNTVDNVHPSEIIPTAPKPKKSKADQKINFEKIYEIYPRKEGKAKAFEKYLKWITTGIEVFGKKEVLTNKEIYAAVVLYARDKEGQDKQYIQMCSTFFNKTIFEYVEKYRKSKEPK